MRPQRANRSAYRELTIVFRLIFRCASSGAFCRSDGGKRRRSERRRISEFGGGIGLGAWIFVEQKVGWNNDGYAWFQKWVPDSERFQIPK
jgi:hypothetical protein